MKNNPVKNKIAETVARIETRWREGLRCQDNLRIHFATPFTTADYDGIRLAIDQLGPGFAEVMFAALALCANHYGTNWNPDGGSLAFAPTIRGVCEDLDAFALAVLAQGDVTFQPRRVAVDWDHAGSIERAWRLGAFPAVGLRGTCCWPWTREHVRLAADLIARFEEGRATTLVERVLKNWDRFRFLSANEHDAPSIAWIAANADQWMPLAENYSGPPPYTDLAAIPYRSDYAHSPLELAWHEAVARRYPAAVALNGDGYAEEPWNIAEIEAIERLAVRWGAQWVAAAMSEYVTDWWTKRGSAGDKPYASDFAEDFLAKREVLEARCGTVLRLETTTTAARAAEQARAPRDW